MAPLKAENDPYSRVNAQKIYVGKVGLWQGRSREPKH